MPLPFIIAGIAIAAGVSGIAKGVKAVSDNNEASEMNESAHRLFDSARQELELQKEVTTEDLTELGELKLRTWDKQMGGFVSLFSRLKNVELTGDVHLDRFKAVTSTDSLAEMKRLSINAAEVVGGGLGALGGGALAGIAAYGGAMTFGAASTGTAISALTGVAATNATLAWFGGGSLAAGGLGMAGGMAVLGGIVAGPALFIGGMVLSAKARENLANARSNYAQARQGAEQMRNASAALEGISKLVTGYSHTITALTPQMDRIHSMLQGIMLGSGEDYRSFTIEQRQVVHLYVEHAHLMKSLLETPLLTEDGAITLKASRTLNECNRVGDSLKLPSMATDAVGSQTNTNLEQPGSFQMVIDEVVHKVGRGTFAFGTLQQGSVTVGMEVEISRPGKANTRHYVRYTEKSNDGVIGIALWGADASDLIPGACISSPGNVN